MFEFLAQDMCPDCYDTFPFTEDERIVLYRSEFQNVLDNTREFLRKRNVLVFPIRAME